MKCKNCGYKLDEHFKYCPNCSYKISHIKDFIFYMILVCILILILIINFGPITRFNVNMYLKSNYKEQFKNITFIREEENINKEVYFCDNSSIYVPDFGKKKYYIATSKDNLNFYIVYSTNEKEFYDTYNIYENRKNVLNEAYKLLNKFNYKKIYISNDIEKNILITNEEDLNNLQNYNKNRAIAYTNNLYINDELTISIDDNLDEFVKNNYETLNLLEKKYNEYKKIKNYNINLKIILNNSTIEYNIKEDDIIVYDSFNQRNTLKNIMDVLEVNYGM